MISIHAPRVGRDYNQLDSQRKRKISIHAPRVGRDCPASRFRSVTTYFNPRAPCGARQGSACISVCLYYFNPRAPCGARPAQKCFYNRYCVFQSTRPVWGATFFCRNCLKIGSFQSTRPVWGATRKRVHIRLPLLFQSTRPVWGATSSKMFLQSLLCISIHAPRVGRDYIPHRGWALHQINFNPRAPCGARRLHMCRCSRLLDFNPRAPCGARPGEKGDTGAQGVFQSTRPVWGATRLGARGDAALDHFNPRAPCGARLIFSFLFLLNSDFNPRAPCGARPYTPERIAHQFPYFNPRAPCGARHDARRQILYFHNLFQSTRPVWGATVKDDMSIGFYPFQSTRPVWGATTYQDLTALGDNISIHAPRVGRDALNAVLPGNHRQISIHAPRVGRDANKRLCNMASPISIHAPRVGRDKRARMIDYSEIISIHAPRVGRDRIPRKE